MANKRVAIVTGGNKGVGFATVKALCNQFQGDVILTARDEGRGKAACAELHEQGYSAKFHQLDITDTVSVQRLAGYIKEEYGGLDVLVNNAGIAFKMASTAPLEEKSRVTMATNFFGTMDVSQKLFPLLRPSARVVQVASLIGQLKRLKNPELEKKASSAEATEEDIVQLANSYLEEVAAAGPSGQMKNWPTDSAYGVSKVLLIALTKAQARAMAAARSGDGICINACCPGYVDTDMSSHKGHLTPDQGAETPTMCALLPEGSPTGEFYSEKKIAEW